MSIAQEPAEFKPYVADNVIMPEFTWPAVLVGAVLGIVFGASSLYLVLKVGMTVSASIPVAVLSITLFRWFGKTFGMRPTTILENNIVQTTGSAGESIAFGVGVTMPTLMLIGFEMEWTRVLVVSVLGGLLGILMMIPLRRAFIVKQHRTLVYPEGTACAQVLISGEKGGTSGKTVFIGFGLAFAHKIITEGMNLLVTTVELPLKLGRTATDAFSRVAHVTSDMASELLGVGYVIGMRTSAIMMAGAILGGLVLAPTIAMSSDAADMNTSDILKNYIRFIGAGCVAAAGIISMARTLPMIVRSFSSSLSNLGGGAKAVHAERRTERDMPPSIVLGGSVLLLGLLVLFLIGEVSLPKAVMGAFLVLIFGFLFVTVSSRLTGEIGSSSNPISGMTVATLLMTCLIFLSLGMTSDLEAVLALSIGGVVCIAASNGGTTSQDLKTGYLVGATPSLQQWAILVGALTSAVVIGGTLLLFNSVGTIYSQRNLPRVNLKSELADLKEIEDYQSEKFHVWRPNDTRDFHPIDDPAKVMKVKAGKYLVDDRGQVIYKVDPTITGELDQRDEFVAFTDAKTRLTPAEIARIPNSVAMRDKDGDLVVYKLWRNNKESWDDAEANKDNPTKVEPYHEDVKKGTYLIDAAGNIVYEVKGTKVAMKFQAPKTVVMGIIINGLLNQKLNWALVMIGAMIAVTLELCQVSSLAFAVGVYIPMQYSTPIFLGGVVRWLVDGYGMRKARREVSEAAHAGEEARAAAEIRAIARSESSPAMLLATGLIAGGSLAGVLNAFMEFLPANIHSGFDFGDTMNGLMTPVTQQIIAFIIFLGLAGVVLLAGHDILFKSPPEEPSPPPDDAIQSLSH